MQLNNEQKAAVSHTTGPALVIAGAGSGKTAVITHRVKNLIEECAVKPSEILTITFTKSAAIEMQRRFLRLTESSYQGSVFGTFHSVFYNIMLRSNPDISYKFMKKYDADRILEHVLKEYNLKYTNESVSALLKAFSVYKNHNKDLDISKKLLIPYDEHFDRLFNRYEEIRKEYFYIDFDDIIPDCIGMFREKNNILKLWSERFKYIQIDEFQDVNSSQLEIISILAKPEKNVFAVGDDDQAIYSFRGSDPKAIIDFDKIYEGSARYILNTNYRSTKSIISTASKVISQNRQRIEKNPAAFSDEPCEKINVKEFETSAEELSEIISYIKSRSNEDCCVLLRTNELLFEIAQKFTSANISFYMKERPGSFYSSACIKDITAYLKSALSLNADNNREYFIKIMNKPPRYILRRDLKDSFISENELIKIYGVKPYMIKIIKTLFKDLKIISGLRPKLAIKYIRTAVSYESFCEGMMDNEAFERAREQMDIFQKKAETFKSIAEFVKFIDEEIKAEEIFIENQSINKNSGNFPLKLMTIHASKGLEFETVFIPYLNEGIIPPKTAREESAIEEERRLLYVAITRAKKNLFMSCHLKDERNEEMMKSSFIKQI